jgi:arylsulfatase A-like enzyme
VPGQDFRLPPGHPTLPSLLKQRGYRTALIGKWYIGFNPAAGPLDYGYDLSRDQRERADRIGDEPQRLAGLKAAYAAWNATMLPYPATSYSYDVKQIDADRY